MPARSHVPYRTRTTNFFIVEKYSAKIIIRKLTAFEKFVLMIPGAKQLTRMFSGAKSCAAAFVNPNSVVLLTEYAPNIYNLE